MTEDIMEKYKHLGLKLTPQRLAILSYLDGNKEHPSAEDIYKAMSKDFPTMSFATVYNTLETLRDKGGVLELTIDPNKKRYDPNTAAHHHLICMKCKRIIDIHKEFSLNIPDEMTEGFDLVGNHVELYGICPKCKKSS
ncbi:MAG: transcriptional repressor [Nitrospirae bacterium]|nr:transcriptional repressor [Nitrospirota bacterium]